MPGFPNSTAFPLADAIPLWRITSEQDATVLITPALDYVGALELGGLDVRYVAEEAAAGVGEALRSFVGGLEDRCSLLFLSRVYEGDPRAVEAYEGATRLADTPALQAYVRGRAAWLAQQSVRRCRQFLFFSCAGPVKSALERGNVGLKLVYKRAARMTQDAHDARIHALVGLRDKLVTRLKALGVGSQELSVPQVRQLHYELLNPSRTKAAGSAPAPKVGVRQQLWSERKIQGEGDFLREYTEAEQLSFEDITDCGSYLRQGNVLRRACSMKMLPDNGTDYFAARPLQSLSLNVAGTQVPFGYTLAVAVNIEPQALKKYELNLRHKLVHSLRNAIPFLRGDTNISQDVEDAAQRRSIAELFTELNDMASKIVATSMTLLLDAASIDELDQKTEVAREAFSKVGNAELMVDDVAQVAHFLCVLPGSGPYQVLRKGCTSRNAADFLPLASPWCGGRTGSLMLTPSGEFMRFAFFDQALASASHGIVCADTGEGKSVTVAALMIDALAGGCDVILVDNGNSWRALTQVMGGIHIPVDLNTSICPFGTWETMVDAHGELDFELVQQIVRFIELCVADRSLPSFDLEQQYVVSRAVIRCYRERFAPQGSAAEARPLMGDFRDYLVKYVEDGTGTAKDRALATELISRLRLFCDDDGPFSRLLNRPSSLRFDARLLTFEMEKVSKDPLVKKIAVAAIMEAVSARAAQRRRPTIVAVDEAHEYLGGDAAAESWLGGSYAKMRKYGVAMLSISQKFETFAASRVAPVIIGNSAIKLFLRHSSGHEVVGKYFKLPARAVKAFAGLERRLGHFTEVFVMYGDSRGVMRVALHPFAYWLFTTDFADKQLLERTAAKNPHLDRSQVLIELAARYPRGANEAGLHAA